jgi:hypothetical protein
MTAQQPAYFAMDMPAVQAAVGQINMVLVVLFLYQDKEMLAVTHLSQVVSAVVAVLLLLEAQAAQVLLAVQAVMEHQIQLPECR